MKSNVTRSRKSRYARVSLLLTVLVIAVTVLFNVVLTTLAKRYVWYTPMTGDYSFETSDAAFAVLSDAFAAEDAAGKKNPPIRILFCDEKKNLLSDAYTRYMYETADALAKRFPERITVECHDIIVNPDSIRPYQTSVDLVTGEETVTPLDNTGLVMVCGDRYETYSVYDFFAYKDSDVESVWAYRGELTMVSGLLRVLEEDRPSAVLTTNHGENFYDAELFYLLESAGYTLRFVDLYKDEIPADCELLITYNPNADFTVNDGVAEVSEIEKIESFLAEGGRSYLALIDYTTPELPHLEAFLESWGIDAYYHKPASSNDSFRYMVRDEARSLTSDGYTIFGNSVSRAVTEKYADASNGVGVVFKDATALRAASGFVPQGDYAYAKGNRTVYGVYTSSEGARAYANGSAVDDGAMMLMAISEESLGEKHSYVGVCGSVQLWAEDYLQSAVYGNHTAFFGLFERLGRDYTPKGLNFQPFRASEISSITTTDMVRWTLVLTVVPAAVVVAVAVWRLVRRRRV